MKTEAMKFGPRRGLFVNAQEELRAGKPPLSAQELANFETFDAVYRALVAVLYNYVPLSGHPGGSISSGRFVSMLLFDTMDYDFARPDREDADVISYAAGHKALGLYAMWALRNEIIRISAPGLLPASITASRSQGSSTTWYKDWAGDSGSHWQAVSSP